MCNEFFYRLAFHSVSYHKALSRSDTRKKAELELLTGTVTKPVDRCKRKSPRVVSIFRLFKGVYKSLNCICFELPKGKSPY